MAADAPTPDANTAIILAVIGLLSVVLVAVVTGVFSLLSAKANRTAPAPPSPLANVSDVSLLRERVAVLERRAEDNDERDDIQDHRIDAIERAKDIDHPGWRDHL